MTELSPALRRSLALRLLALGAAAAVFASGAPRAACARTAAPAVATADPDRLFADSRMIVQPRISVEVVGSGPDVILIPGLASSRETWRRTAERLRATHRVHLVQVAGFSGEPARANAEGPVFDPVLEALDAYAAALPRPPVVMGHSLGGTLGLALAERHPQHLSRLLIVDALPFYGVVTGGPGATAESVRPAVEKMRAGPVAPMSPARTEATAAFMVTGPADRARLAGWMTASDPAVTVRAMTDDMLADLRPGLAAVRTPVTVLYETPLKAMMEAGYAPLGPKTLVEVPGSKHFIMYDQPDRFDAEVDAFLKR